jgi:dTDP-4-dehydrorhamnose reductase
LTTRRRVAITGASGKLGRALTTCCGDRWDIDAWHSAHVDLRDWRAVRDRLARFAPDLVVHAGAATDVDRCEREPHWAYAVNALGTQYVARAAELVQAELAYVSTNYVFDGGQAAPYHEFDAPRPISVYGASKLAGEREACAATSRCFVVRTAWLYAEDGRNFVNTMRRLMATQPSLRVVADQVGNPTYATDLAETIIQLVERGPYGTYHAVNAGVTSWHGWAVELARLDGHSSDTIEPIPASDYQRAAAPPPNGALVSLALPGLGIELPDWRDALRRCLQR